MKYLRYFGTHFVERDMSTEKIFIVTEFADAEDLSMLIRKQKTDKKQYLSEKNIHSYFVQITLGLNYIHKKNIIHRDLKTKNIFLTKQKLIKIGDFGISKSLTHAFDLATTAIGTPHYLSPEICRQEPYNHKSDMWSLGDFCLEYKITKLLRLCPL